MYNVEKIKQKLSPIVAHSHISMEHSLEKNISISVIFNKILIKTYLS
jgi:hypothetical protein